MKGIYLIFGAGLSLAPVSAAAQQPPTPALPRADAAAYVGWFAANKGALGAYDRWYGRSWHGGLSAGFYWTEHVKTEVAFGATSRADLYGRPFQIVTPSGQPAGNIRYESKVKMALTDGTRLKAVLMAVGERDVAVRLRTRIPEAPSTIAFDQIVDVEVEKESGIGRAIAVGAAVGAASAISVFLLIIAALGD